MKCLLLKFGVSCCSQMGVKGREAQQAMVVYHGECGHFLFLFVLLGLLELELGWISELGCRVKSCRVLGFSRWRRGTQFALWQHHLSVLLSLVLMCRESQWTPFGQKFFLLLGLWRISAWILSLQAEFSQSGCSIARKQQQQLHGRSLLRTGKCPVLGYSIQLLLPESQKDSIHIKRQLEIHAHAEDASSKGAYDIDP